MRSVLVTSTVLVAGALLSLVQALGADKQPITAAALSKELSDHALPSGGARESNPSIIRHSYQTWIKPDSINKNRLQVSPHRRSYDTPLFLGKRQSYFKDVNLRSKRATDFENGDESDLTDSLDGVQDKRGYNTPQFVGRRAYGAPAFVGKRYIDAPQFLGKKASDVPQFVGKRELQSPFFVGRRGYGVPAFVGKRYAAPHFVGRRMVAPAFVGKRDYNVPSFVGKRGYGVPAFVGKRGYGVPAFVGKREFGVPAFVGKRGYGAPAFVGKRGYGAPAFVGKRGYGAPAFVGKRDMDAPAFVGKRKDESIRDLLATLQAYREYRRLLQTDKRFEAPLFVGKRQDNKLDMLQESDAEPDQHIR